MDRMLAARRLEARSERAALFADNETKILFTSQYGMCILF
jgi:hypothetical protein